MKINEIRKRDIGIFLIFCLVLYFPVFLHLDVMPITIWDESLFSIRALHFAQFGEYMENFNNYPGLADHRNTKLPFTTFFQVLGIKIFGINELAIRLPIAIIFVATVFYVCYFAKEYLGNIYIAYLFALILVSSSGFVTTHMLRTGDQDAPFACYLLLATLFFHRYLFMGKSRYLLGFSFFTIAAFLTKNLLAGLLAPGLLLYLIFSGQLLKVLKDYRIYIAVGSIVVAYLGTIFYYESQYPGFIDRMWNYELMGRYTKTIEGHRGGFLHYAMKMFKEGFVPFMYAVPVSVALVLDKKMNAQIRQLLLLVFAVFAAYLLVISFSETKTAWYHAPLFPLGAIMVALGMYHMYTAYLSNANIELKRGMLIATVLIFAVPYSIVIDQVYKPEPIFKDDKYGNFIEDIAQGNPDLKTFTIVDNYFGASAYFYKEKFNSRGYNIDYQRSFQLDSGELMITCLNTVFQPIRDQYKT